jgi:eukaryotic-like serine/threonine-protein kinase
MNFQVGSTIGDYEVVGVLGAGGMGEVYKVRNTIFDRIEAMKVLLADLAHEPDLADRFLREIKVQASLKHPNIAALHTAVRADNHLLMLMEFVEGVALDQKAKGGPLPVPEAVDYIVQVLGALEYAHSRGVVHRDIKPANMMLTAGGVVKLMDFGIAKAASDRALTMTGTTVGSLYYMSPEQIQGAQVDARSDLYAVGVSLYELLTGKRPFDGDSQFAIMAAHLEKAPVPPIEHDPKLPQALNDLILMAVAKDPKVRFQTAGAFRNGLAAVMRAALPVTAPLTAAVPPPVTAPVSAPAPAPVPQPLPPVPQAAKPAPQRAAPPPPPPVPVAGKSRRGLWMAVGALAVVAVAIAAIQFGPWKRTQAAPEQPQPVAAQPASPAIETPLPQPVAAPPVEPAAAPSAPVVNTRPAPAKSAAVPARQVPAVVEPPPAAPQVVQQRQPEIAPGRQVAEEAPPVQRAAPPQAAPAPNRAELQKSREQLMMLGTRAAGIRSSLQSMQRSQAAGGMSLRGDMQEAASLMNSYMEGATAALNAGDLDAVKSFSEKAERQIEKLEKFLGR